MAWWIIGTEHLRAREPIIQGVNFGGTSDKIYAPTPNDGDRCAYPRCALGTEIPNGAAARFAAVGIPNQWCHKECAGRWEAEARADGTVTASATPAPTGVFSPSRPLSPGLVQPSLPPPATAEDVVEQVFAPGNTVTVTNVPPVPDASVEVHDHNVGLAEFEGPGNGPRPAIDGVDGVVRGDFEVAYGNEAVGQVPHGTVDLPPEPPVATKLTVEAPWKVVPAAEVNKTRLATVLLEHGIDPEQSVCLVGCLLAWKNS